MRKNPIYELIKPIEEIIDSMIIAAALDDKKVEYTYRNHGSYLSWSLYCKDIAAFMRIETSMYNKPVDLYISKSRIAEDESFDLKIQKLTNQSFYNKNWLAVEVEEVAGIAGIVLEYV